MKHASFPQHKIKACHALRSASLALLTYHSICMYHIHYRFSPVLGLSANWLKYTFCPPFCFAKLHDNQNAPVILGRHSLAFTYGEFLSKDCLLYSFKNLTFFFIPHFMLTTYNVLFPSKWVKQKSWFLRQINYHVADNIMQRFEVIFLALDNCVIPRPYF